jgi:hypothetical protein
MSEILSVKWTIVPQKPPQPWLHCKRCGGTRTFRSKDKLRVNANGKRVDAWLIYKCTSCDHTWNRPILERRHVRSVDPIALASLHANDPKLAGRLAFDVAGLKRWAPRLAEVADVVITKEVLSGSIAQARQLLILCVVPHPISLRVDRLLAEELQLSRSRVQALAKSGALAAPPSGSRMLCKAVRDGMKLMIKLPVHDVGWIAEAAARATSDRIGERESSD